MDKCHASSNKHLEPAEYNLNCVWSDQPVVHEESAEKTVFASFMGEFAFSLTHVPHCPSSSVCFCTEGLESERFSIGSSAHLGRWTQKTYLAKDIKQCTGEKPGRKCNKILAVVVFGLVALWET